MSGAQIRFLVRWMLGAAIGTAIIGFTSPLFVRSYLTQSIDPVRQVLVLPQGADYRWRSEGYATTHIGPLGMPGKPTLAPPRQAVTRIALWGDSQVEGLAVADDQKLFAQIESQSGGRFDVLPLARSGDDARDWMQQFPRVEFELGIDLHAIVVADLPDLLAASLPQPLASTHHSNIDANRSRNLRVQLPAFVIQAARNLLTEADGTQLKSLRFSVGPIRKAAPTKAKSLTPTLADWTRAMEVLQDSADKPIVIVYVPPSPYILAGQAYFDDPALKQFRLLRAAAESISISVVNVHSRMKELARGGRWPHGFHNGYIGAGHLNADGYSIIATELVDSIGRER